MASAKQVRGTFVVACALVAGLVTAACGGDGGDSADTAALPQQVLVGEVAGTDAFIAVVTSGNLASAFVCDGDEGIWEIFASAESDASLELTSRDGAKITGEIAEDSATGTLTVRGQKARNFSAERASGEAGLYLAGGEDERAGWVVLGTGEQRGAVQLGARVTAAPPLQLPAATAAVPGLGQITATKVAPGPSRAGLGGFGGHFGFGG